MLGRDCSFHVCRLLPNISFCYRPIDRSIHHRCIEAPPLHRAINHKFRIDDPTPPSSRVCQAIDKGRVSHILTHGLGRPAAAEF